MTTFFSVLIIIVCILLILIVLVQNSKGGGLASGFASTNQVMGVRKTTDFLEKATWTLAIALVVLCLISTAVTTPGGGGDANDTELREKINETPDAKPAPAPIAPGTQEGAPAQ